MLYKGSGPLDRERASRVADLDSRASRQGNDIAGFEASAAPAEVAWGPLVWNDRAAFCDFVDLGLGGVAGFFNEVEEDCRIQRFGSVREGRATTRAAVMKLLVEFIVGSLRRH